MNVVVDASVWSLALRRHRPDAPEVEALVALLRDDRAALLNPVRQEVLSGVRDPQRFRTLRDELRTLPEYPLTATHHEVAAESFNACRAKGIQGSGTDFLICAASLLDRLPIFTTDQDFARYAAHLPITLYRPA
ncbi:MAG: PilT protein domain protein [Phycisphaerales bacterium]|nr:PilT protein domain protein [Phycisphaerales bacterium]